MTSGSHKTRDVARLVRGSRPVREGGMSGFHGGASWVVPSLGRAERGVAFAEYVVLLCLVVVGGSTALYSLGLPLVRMARFAQFVLGLPIP